MHLKLQHNFLLALILSGFLFMGGQSQSIAQDGSGVSNVSDTESKTIRQEAGASDEENHDTKDLEQLLKRYNTNSKKVLEDTTKMPAAEDAAKSEVKDSDINEMRPSEDPMKNGAINAFKKVKEENDRIRKAENGDGMGPNQFSNSVRLALEPMQKLSEKELFKRFDESTKDSSVRPYLNEFPNFTIFVIKLIKDKESIPSLVKILEDRDRLIYFIGTMLATIIFGFILKRVMHREGRSFIKAAIYFLIRMYVVFALRVFIVYYFFSVEFTPAAKIFKETFMKNM